MPVVVQACQCAWDQTILVLSAVTIALRCSPNCVERTILFAQRACFETQPYTCLGSLALEEDARELVAIFERMIATEPTARQRQVEALEMVMRREDFYKSSVGSPVPRRDFLIGTRLSD
ncbi:hypothetical protein BS47DRAFT_1393616 [Hydnum rufescens UP504]|uniref:Uncharacterized protein n=1 Tax=Hydnum rufescens UP504 TaxID=1448309 RepID=A0A9P6AWB0_9AGAM|nr:hypothetical protein BS47DRAFT_1393616 [Hydnum rufescens UP504]